MQVGRLGRFQLNHNRRILKIYFFPLYYSLRSVSHWELNKETSKFGVPIKLLALINQLRRFRFDLIASKRPSNKVLINHLSLCQPIWLNSRKLLTQVSGIQRTEIEQNLQLKIFFLLSIKIFDDLLQSLQRWRDPSQKLFLRAWKKGSLKFIDGISILFCELSVSLSSNLTLSLRLSKKAISVFVNN